MTVPNWVTLSRLLGLPVILCLQTQPLKLAAGIFLIAITDWVDGYQPNQVTELGKFLDPLVISCWYLLLF